MSEFVACPTCQKKTGKDAWLCKKCQKICCDACGDKYCPSCATRWDGGGLLGSANYTKVGTVRRG
jgi:hypothetical protein